MVKHSDNHAVPSQPGFHCAQHLLIYLWTENIQVSHSDILCADLHVHSLPRLGVYWKSAVARACFLWRSVLV